MLSNVLAKSWPNRLFGFGYPHLRRIPLARLIIDGLVGRGETTSLQQSKLY